MPDLETFGASSHSPRISRRVQYFTRQIDVEARSPPWILITLVRQRTYRGHESWMKFNRSIEYCKICIFKEVEKEVENMNYVLRSTKDQWINERLVAWPAQNILFPQNAKPHHGLGARFVVGLKGHIGTIEMVAQVVLATRCSTNLL